MLDRSKGKRQTKRDTKTDAGSSVISSGLKHRTNDARDGSSLYSNRRDQSGLNGCCTAMWKENEKTATLLLFLDSLFPKTEISYMRDASSGEIKGEREVTRRRKKLLDDLKDRRGYSHWKEEALDRTMWRNRFEGGFGPVVRQNTE